MDNPKTSRSKSYALRILLLLLSLKHKILKVYNWLGGCFIDEFPFIFDILPYLEDTWESQF